MEIMLHNWGRDGDIVEPQAAAQETSQKEGNKLQNATESELDVLGRTADQRDSFWNEH